MYDCAGGLGLGLEVQSRAVGGLSEQYRVYIGFRALHVGFYLDKSCNSLLLMILEGFNGLPVTWGHVALPLGNEAPKASEKRTSRIA